MDGPEIPLRDGETQAEQGQGDYTGSTGVLQRQDLAWTLPQRPAELSSLEGSWSYIEPSWSALARALKTG